MSDPVTFEPLRRPVLVSSGITYEAATVEGLLHRGITTCPVTRKRLDAHVAVQNILGMNLALNHFATIGVYVPPLASYTLMKDLSIDDRRLAAQQAIINDLTTGHIDWTTAREIIEKQKPDEVLKCMHLMLDSPDRKVNRYSPQLLISVDYNEYCTCRIVSRLLRLVHAEALDELAGLVSKLCKGSQIAIVVSSLERSLGQHETVKETVAQLEGYCPT